MDVDVVVLAAATALVGIAQLGIVMTARTRTLRDAAYLGVPVVAAVVLFAMAWLEVLG